MPLDTDQNAMSLGRYGKRSEFKVDKECVIIWSEYVLTRFDGICLSNVKSSTLDVAKIT